MITFEIDTEYIELIKLLKATRIADSGAMAKILVENGEVTRNGEPDASATFGGGFEFTCFHILLVFNYDSTREEHSAHNPFNT